MMSMETGRRQVVQAAVAAAVAAPANPAAAGMDKSRFDLRGWCYLWQPEDADKVQGHDNVAHYSCST
jgi:hypothetical protein